MIRMGGNWRRIKWDILARYIRINGVFYSYVESLREGSMFSNYASVHWLPGPHSGDFSVIYLSYMGRIL